MNFLSFVFVAVASRYPWDSCETLEEDYGCDCTGCACTAGDDCPRTCFGMTCSELVDLGEDDTLRFECSDSPHFPSEWCIFKLLPALVNCCDLSSNDPDSRALGLWG